MTILSVSNASVEFGATTLFTDITFTVDSGERWGVIGRNGTGKTTLFRLLTGEMQPTTGQVTRQSGVKVSLLEQHRDYGDAATVWEAAAGPFRDLLALERSLAEQAAALGANATEAALERYGHDLERFEREGGYTFAPRVDAVLHGLGFDPAEARTRPISALSGGERGRLGLARQLVAPADVLLLDEPTNHLDLDTTRWLEQYLQSATDRTVALISHDRAFLAAVVDHVLHMEEKTAFAYRGSYESFLQQREERRLTQQRQFEKQQKVIAAESDYIARNIAGQNTAQAKGRRKRLERMPRLSAPGADIDAMALRFESGARGGDQVVVAERVTVAVPGSAVGGGDPDDDGMRPLVEDFTARLTRGETLAIVGPNGAGKSTLLRALLGEHPVAEGELRLGGSIEAAYYRQDLAQVPLGKTLYEVISDLRPTWERRLVQGHLGRFGFSGDEVLRRADTLSGGERARVALAMMVLGRANLLVLDEPTNHLDVESVEALEDALGLYQGTTILVSHDRALLRALATKLWVLHERRITEFDGSFAEWETVSAERAHAASVAAAEEAAMGRMKEKQKVQRKQAAGEDVGGRRDDGRREARRAQRAAEDAERRAMELERRVSALTAEMEDPALYAKADGAQRAAALGVQLEAARRELDAALEAWNVASEEAEKYAGK
ncbi:MAG TPA: ABC-F family ATP-binding cassette domain-containing protein [Gemmatimonadaceae bacterium]|nr:ABC-F family ATP-binding cassette domain-containing protein [Gemmatimonadaceae bacterium]